jgi:hypothetical protein
MDQGDQVRGHQAAVIRFIKSEIEKRSGPIEASGVSMD